VVLGVATPLFGFNIDRLRGIFTDYHHAGDFIRQTTRRWFLVIYLNALKINLIFL